MKLTLLLSTLLLPCIAGASQECPATKAAKARLAAHTDETDIVDTAVAAGGFRTLAAALEAADLIGALKGEGPFTVFAPTDEAFAKLPEGTVERLLKPENRATLQAILTYHVVAGDLMAKDVAQKQFATTLNGQRIDVSADREKGVTVDGARVVRTDIDCSNGVIHVIDSVIMPETSDVVGVAVANGRFETLAAALRAAQLVEALQGDGPFTVFAPTDAAFAALPEGTVETLLKPENKERLTAVLKYHVVPGRVYSEQAAKLESAKTLQGQELRIRAKDGTVKVGGAKVVKADVEATNGVIHVIDRVLLPE